MVSPKEMAPFAWLKARGWHWTWTWTRLKTDMGTTRLFLTATVEEQWRALIEPWLRNHAGGAWKNSLPTAVLTPSRAESFYLRSRLVEKGLAFLGLRFWTPTDVRKFLLSERSSEIAPASRADLRLLARCCAEKLLRKDASDPESTTWSSVVQEPDTFLRAYDLLVGAGWDPAKDGPVYGRSLATEMTRELRSLKIATQAELHRDLAAENSGAKEPLIAHLLVVGFNATHWPLWDLLQAVAVSAEQAAVALLSPRVFGEEVDQLWINSWEEMARVSTEIPENSSDEQSDAPFAGLVASYERGEAAAVENVDLTFLVSPDLTSQVRAIILQVMEYLKRDSCTRLGIVFPEENALALAVAEQLQQMGLPLDDGIGFIQPGLFEQRPWQTWLALQEEPSVQRLTQWLRACEAREVPCGIENSGLSARDIADVLENALGETLVDDLNFLALHLEETSTRSREGAVGDVLRKRIELPGVALFSEFLEKVCGTLRALGWEEHLARLQATPLVKLEHMDQVLSRSSFLKWLKEATDSKEQTRGREGNHFYGKIHLLIYAQMTGQAWTHLILTGLNEGIWPRLFEAGAFGSRHELAALNRQARSLNAMGKGEGAQGAGHEIVQAGHGYCLLPLEKRDLALRDLCAAIEGTSGAACLAAMTSEAGRSLLPSDFFNHAYQIKTGHVLDETALQNLEAETTRWCRQHEFLFRSARQDNDSPGIAATRRAYEARRDESKPFGPFEFAYAQPPGQTIQLSCKTWETAWNHPATVWLEHVVGVSAWPEGILSWSRAIGTWTHRWLATALRTCKERNSIQEFLPLLQEATDRGAIQIENRARAVGLDLYPWWEPVWAQAQAMTLGLGQRLAPHLANKQFLSEYRLPENIQVALPGMERADFVLTGRIDLLLIDNERLANDLEKDDFSDCTCWVIDFKTGAASKLNLKAIEKGRGLQPLLYALAVRAKGARSVAISLSTPDAPLAPQLTVDEALEVTSLFRSFDIFHRAGIFGMRGNMENEYGYAPVYPLATRWVPKNILDAKWASIHGEAAVPEETSE